jgi:hypothetical protein
MIFPPLKNSEGWCLAFSLLPVRILHNMNHFGLVNVGERKLERNAPERRQEASNASIPDIRLTSFRGPLVRFGNISYYAPCNRYTSLPCPQFLMILELVVPNCPSDCCECSHLPPFQACWIKRHQVKTRLV